MPPIEKMNTSSVAASFWTKGGIGYECSRRHRRLLSRQRFSERDPPSLGYGWAWIWHLFPRNRKIEEVLCGPRSIPLYDPIQPSHPSPHVSRNLLGRFLPAGRGPGSWLRHALL